jgi:hypothetical protein
VQSFLQVLKPFDEAKASALFEATRRRFAAFAQADNLAQLVLQLHLKHVEMAGDMVSAYRRLHFATAATLSRTLLDGGVTLMWAIANGDDVEAGYDQLLRVLAKGYQEQARQAAKARAPALTRTEQGVVSEASARGLAELPDVAGRLRDVDAVWAALGSDTVASHHYPHFAITSAYTHPSRFGPAMFASTPEGLVVYTQGQTLLGAAALYYGACYFCVGYQCSAALAGLGAEADWMSERLAAITPLLSRVVEQELE